MKNLEPTPSGTGSYDWLAGRQAGRQADEMQVKFQACCKLGYSAKAQHHFSNFNAFLMLFK